MGGSIKDRVREGVTDGEHQVWRALCESGPSAIDYLDEHCVFLTADGETYAEDTKPSLQKYLKSPEFVPYASFHMSDVRVVHLGLMEAVITYSVTASRARAPGKKPREYRAICSSAWRQTAGAEWKICSHQQTVLFDE